MRDGLMIKESQRKRKMENGNSKSEIGKSVRTNKLNAETERSQRNKKHFRIEEAGCYSPSWMVRSRTTSNSFLPAGVATSISSPTLRLRRALPIGEVVEMRPFSASASSVLTRVYSTFASRCTSRRVSREPYPERSFGILLRFSML